jgi:hypothetical protein
MTGPVNVTPKPVDPKVPQKAATPAPTAAPVSPTKTTTLPAVETPDAALQVVAPKKPVNDPIAPTNADTND